VEAEVLKLSGVSQMVLGAVERLEREKAVLQCEMEEARQAVGALEMARDAALARVRVRETVCERAREGGGEAGAGCCVGVGACERD